MYRPDFPHSAFAEKEESSEVGHDDLSDNSGADADEEEEDYEVPFHLNHDLDDDLADFLVSTHDHR